MGLPGIIRGRGSGGRAFRNIGSGSILRFRRFSMSRLLRRAEGGKLRVQLLQLFNQLAALLRPDISIAVKLLLKLFSLHVQAL